MPWLDDLQTLAEDEGLVLNRDLFVTTASNPNVSPSLPSGEYLLIVETSGSGAERTHNDNAVRRPRYIHPSALLQVRGYRSYNRCRKLAVRMYDRVNLVHNAWVVGNNPDDDGVIHSGWYREITPSQEPFDAGFNDKREKRCSFNVTATRLY